MGVLRVYLALCVIAFHSGRVLPWQMNDGKQAVQIFYIISGFYMAMVLTSRYASPRDFYLSRVMRIFPPFWIVLLGTVLVSAAGGLLFHQWLMLSAYVAPVERNGAAGILLVAFSNLTLIGQDWVMFLSHDYGRPLRLTANFWKDASPLWNYLLIPQAWSVGLELTFYAFAPYLNRLRSRWLLFIALGALAARLFAYWRLGLSRDPWDYRFFPFEITLFLFGMLGYRLYARTTAHHPSQRFRCASQLSYLIGSLTLLIFLYIHVRVMSYLCQFTGENIGVLISYPFWALGIPVLFFIFGNQKVDRMIGELSYPVYLIHYIVIMLVTLLLKYFGFTRGIGVSSALISLIAAGILFRVVIVPLDRKRHFLTRTKPSPSPGSL